MSTAKQRLRTKPLGDGNQATSKLLTSSQLKDHLTRLRGKFYVYHLILDNEPFYVGVGRRHRVFVHERHAQAGGDAERMQMVRSAGTRLRYRIVAVHDDFDSCLIRERAEISRYGRRDLGTGILTNLTDGGAGASGAFVWNPNAPGARGVANRLFLRLMEVTSVPIRPGESFKPIHLVPHRKRVSQTPRMIAALAASAISHRIELVDGCRIPRKMEQEGVVLLIENGAGASIVESGLATLVAAAKPEDEAFQLDRRAVERVRVFVEKELLAQGR